MPPHRRFAILVLALLTALTVSISAAFASWPTTCVELNDLAEAAAGNDQNVGIYQRTFGDGAEEACRRDHLDDVRAVFAWAIPEADTPPEPAPATLETTEPASDPTQHPDYERVRQVALARGADEALAADVAAFVVTQGNVDSYLRGTHPGVAYGEHGCPWRSPACPLAPEAPSGPISFRIAPSLQPAWDLLVSVSPSAGTNADLQTVDVRWGTLTDEPGYRTNAGYSSEFHTIYINSDLRNERPEALAALLAHEAWHASSPFPRPHDPVICVVDEVWAFIAQSFVWWDLPAGLPRTPLEESLNETMWVVLSNLGELDFDDDVSDWGALIPHVMYDKGYAQLCAA